MIFLWTNGLSDVPGYQGIKTVPIYLTDDHVLIEVPTLWVADVSRKLSRSHDTLRQHSFTIKRWLQFLDDYYKNETQQGAYNWQAVDRLVAEHFIDILIDGRDKNGSPNDESIEIYMSHIVAFYRWAKGKGYPHYWELNNDEFKWIIKDRTTTTKDITVTGVKREIQLHRGATIRVDKEMNKFVSKQDFKVAIPLLDDYVYAVIAYVIWHTGLRPKGLLQLPYKGTGLNAGLMPYRLTTEALTTDIPFEFASKGKRRSILFPSHVWKFICEVWMPMRAIRAERYADNKNLGNGISPSNSVLFLSEEGVPVTYTMLHDHFSKIATHPNYVKKPFTARMLRHSFATYFVYNHMKVNKELGKDYIYNAVTDNNLRKIMGHTDTGITYKFYVHLVNSYLRDDVVDEFIKEVDFDLYEEMITAVQPGT
ncbi:MAG: tyrosine-type recombinase/integrase [Dissulfurispiraceae bacterium]